MRIKELVLAALVCAAAAGASPAVSPAFAQAASKPSSRAAPVQAPAVPDEAPAPTDEGGAGYLPGAQFQRKLDGGPGFVCTATNALRDRQCTASCQAGETADCLDADGSDAPTCRCTRG